MSISILELIITLTKGFIHIARMELSVRFKLLILILKRSKIV